MHIFFIAYVNCIYLIIYIAYMRASIWTGACGYNRDIIGHARRWFIKCDKLQKVLHMYDLFFFSSVYVSLYISRHCFECSPR